GTGKQANVIHLRNTRCEKLKRTRDQVFVVTAPECVVESAIDLIQVQVVCCRARGHPALTVASRVDSLDQLIDVLRSEKARFTVSASANVNDSNPIMSVENGDAVLRPNRKPMSECPCITREQGVQKQGRECDNIATIVLA